MDLSKDALWIFGDSFSMDYNEDSSTNTIEYVKWKGKKIKTYGNFVSETLNYELKNLCKTPLKKVKF